MNWIQLLQFFDIDDMQLIKSLHEDVIRLSKEVDADDIPLLRRYLQGVEEKIITCHKSRYLLLTLRGVVTLIAGRVVYFCILYDLGILCHNLKNNGLKGKSRLQKELPKGKQIRRQSVVEIKGLKVHEESKSRM